MLNKLFNSHIITVHHVYRFTCGLTLIAVLFNGTLAHAGLLRSHTLKPASQSTAEYSNRIAPPEPTDSTFATNRGRQLDQFTYGDQIAVGIAIDRVFSTKPVPEAITRGILPSTFELSLAFYANEPPWCPPLHRITLNGHQLPVILPRADGHWRRFSIAVPTTFLERLPTEPGAGSRPTPGLQKVIIEPDGAGCQCGMEVDWVAITIAAPHPIVFVPGWTGDASTWDAFSALLNTDGMPRFAAVLGNGMQSIPASGFMLSTAIQSVRTNFGVDKVNLVAHSKGGLTARWALDNGGAPYVERLITLGSPHHGIDMARLLVAKLNSCVIRRDSNPLVPDECQDSADEVSIERVREINYADCKLDLGGSGLPVFSGCVRIADPQPGVSYFSIVGSTDAFVDNASSTYPWNANAAPYPSQATIDLSLPGRGHFELKGGRAELDCAMSFIHVARYQCVDAGVLQAMAEHIAEDSAPVQALWISSVITSALSLAVPITVDASTKVSFLIESESPLDFSLRSPSGQMISGNGNPSAEYRAALGLGDQPSSWHYEYTVSSPQSGIWKMQVNAPLTTSLPFKFVVAATSNSPTQLQIWTNKSVYIAGEMALIEASIKNAGTTMMDTHLQISGWLSGPIPVPLTLTDNGAGGDRLAGDGVYSARFTAPAPGTGRSPYLSIQIAANSPSLSRLGIAEIAVRPATARLALTQPMTVSTADVNYNQQFEALSLRPSIYVSQTGHFRIEGKLIDEGGQVVASTSTSTRFTNGPLNTGYQALTLTFAGNQIRQHGQHGPYRLIDLKLFDETNSSILIDSAASVPNIFNYQPIDFEGDTPHILHFEHAAIDTDGNGRYNQLVMTITLTGTNAGDYRFGGQLKDGNGTSVSWAQAHSSLPEGRAVITLMFSGASIAENLSDGPYQLSDLTLQLYNGVGYRGYGTVLRPNYSTEAYHYTDFDSERVTPMFVVDTSKRQSVADFYHAEFVTDTIDLNWSGNLDTCDPGQTTPELKAAMLKRINFYRAMAGLPTVVLSDTFSERAQTTALMMARNNMLSHSPGTDWLCYTDVGATTAKRSNLYYSNSGKSLVHAIDTYMADPYVPSIGHRRLLLHPPTQAMGTGDVLVAESNAHFNALYVQDLSILSLPKPSIRNGFVAWPPAGYVPYDVIYPYWSFAIAGADLLSAKVQMLKDGMPITVTQQAVTTRQADNAIVWVPEGLNPDNRAFRWPQPTPGQEPVYTVIIDGVLLNGAERRFSYTVTVIDPAVTPPQPTPAPTATPIALPTISQQHVFLPVVTV